MRVYSVTKSLLICVVGGALCSYLGIPLAWIIGPLLAMAIGKVSGAQLLPPKAGREAGQIVIACVLGLYFSPAVMREITEHWYLLIFAALLAILIAYASGWFLSRSTGIDGATALFASVPGGAAEMTILGERYGAKVDRVALAQSLRIVMVVLIIPTGITLIGVRGVDIFQPPQIELEYPRLLIFLTAASVGGWCLARLRIPNAWMLGPLFVTIALSMAEVKLSAVPVPLSNLAQLLIGCSLGSRFEQQFLKSAPRFVSMVALSVLFAILLSTLSAWSVAVAGEVAVPTMVLATAPGGIAEMCITAKIMQLGVPLITAAHVTRVIVLVTAMGPVFRFGQAIKLRRQTTRAH